MLAERLQLETVRRMSAATIAIPFEDSPNGVKAAKAAGIFTVAVPLAELPLHELLVRF